MVSPSVRNTENVKAIRIGALGIKCATSPEVKARARGGSDEPNRKSAYETSPNLVTKVRENCVSFLLRLKKKVIRGYGRKRGNAGREW